MKQQKEIEVVTMMIRLYCHKKHKSKHGELCQDCQALLEYMKLRRSKCPFGDQKPFCSNCKIHCYKADMREKMRQVMRFSGPRMLFHHPVVALKHVAETVKYKRQSKKKVKE